MYIRYNNTIKFWEYDTSVAQNGTGPWILLPVDPAKLTGTFPAPGAHHLTHETGGTDALVTLDGSVIKTGTVADARLSANIPKLNVANTFTGTPLTISSPNTATPEVDLNDTTVGIQLRILNYISRFHVYYNPFGSLFQVDLNGALYERKRATAIGEWQAFTPTITGSGSMVITGGTRTAKYSLIGKTCFYHFQFDNFTITVAPAGQTEIYVSIPFPVSTLAGNITGNFHYLFGGVWKQGMVYAAVNDNLVRCLAQYNSEASYLWGNIVIPIATTSLEKEEKESNG